jgi:hypothetical protein
MSRCSRTGIALLLGLLAWAHAWAAEEPERQRLVQLFKKVQDVLLTVNSEVIQYGERFQDVATRLRDRELWAEQDIDQTKLVPMLRELNRLKMALGLIGTGLEQKYAQIRTFQAELRDRYPTYQRDVDHYYDLFDQVYENTRERHRKLTREMDELKTWFKQRMAARQPQEEAEEEAPAKKPRRRSRGQIASR